MLDPFCGSGTTMLASISNGRNSINVETEAYYCEHTIKRIRSVSKTLPDHQFEYIDLSHEPDTYRKDCV